MAEQLVHGSVCLLRVLTIILFSLILSLRVQGFPLLHQDSGASATFISNGLGFRHRRLE